MSFQPVSLLPGYAGWQFLQRSSERQESLFAQSPSLVRETDHFKANIGDITSAKDLVSDPMLLRVALGAFGLDDDANKQFFVRKVLEEGTIQPDAFANRLVDKRYAAMSDAFGFGSLFGPKNNDEGFADKIAAAYVERQFEIAIGNSDDNMRLALTFDREIGAIASSSSSDETKWLTVLGNPPLRTVMMKAFNLPSAFGTLDIDRQVDAMRDKLSAMVGSSDLASLAESENVSDVLKSFLVRAEIDGNSAGLSGGSVALTLLGQAGGSATPGAPSLSGLFAALHR